MRVLYVNHTATVSGAEKSLLGLLRHLPAGVEPLVACPRGPLASAAAGLGVHVSHLEGTTASLRLHPLHTSKGLAQILWSKHQLNGIKKRTGAELVHCNSVRAALSWLTGLRPSRASTIVHVRDGLPAGRAADLTRRVAMRAGLVIANSQWTAGRLGLEGPSASVEVVANAVELDRFDPSLVSQEQARGRLGLDPAQPVLGVIGQVTPWKAQSDAIRATSRLVRRWPDLQLLLVGSVKFRSGSTRYDNDAYMASLHRLVEQLDLGDHVRFLGEREDVPDILRALDLLLVPSWEEPFGRVVIEAMAMRTPVIATSQGGPAEVIDDDVDGRLLPPRDPDCWAETIEKLLADPAGRRAMGMAGRAKVVERFDQRSQAARITELYQRLVAAGARS